MRSQVGLILSRQLILIELRYVGVPLLSLMGGGNLCLMGGGNQGGMEQLQGWAVPARDLSTSGLTSKPFSTIFHDFTHSVSYCLGLDKLGLEEEQEEEAMSWTSTCSSNEDLEEYIEGWDRCKSAPLPRTPKLYRRVITSSRPKTGGALLTSSSRHWNGLNEWAKCCQRQLVSKIVASNLCDCWEKFEDSGYILQTWCEVFFVTCKSWTETENQLFPGDYAICIDDSKFLMAIEYQWFLTFAPSPLDFFGGINHGSNDLLMVFPILRTTMTRFTIRLVL